MGTPAPTDPRTPVCKWRRAKLRPCPVPEPEPELSALEFAVLADPVLGRGSRRPLAVIHAYTIRPRKYDISFNEQSHRTFTTSILGLEAGVLSAPPSPKPEVRPASCRFHSGHTVSWPLSSPARPPCSSAHRPRPDTPHICFPWLCLSPSTVTRGHQDMSLVNCSALRAA